MRRHSHLETGGPMRVAAVMLLIVLAMIARPLAGSLHAWSHEADPRLGTHAHAPHTHAEDCAGHAHEHAPGHTQDHGQPAPHEPTDRDGGHDRPATCSTCHDLYLAKAVDAGAAPRAPAPQAAGEYVCTRTGRDAPPERRSLVAAPRGPPARA
ncbi:MAG: hypothetical protein SFY69_12280 [Planctomycetota bacterium]|nr:hypothetical protein [Planctomycetota bacterium]